MREIPTLINDSEIFDWSNFSIDLNAALHSEFIDKVKSSNIVSVSDSALQMTQSAFGIGSFWICGYVPLMGATWIHHQSLYQRLISDSIYEIKEKTKESTGNFNVQIAHAIGRKIHEGAESNLFQQYSIHIHVASC